MDLYKSKNKRGTNLLGFLRSGCYTPRTPSLSPSSSKAPHQEAPLLKGFTVQRALEPRILLDAAGAATVSEVIDTATPGVDAAADGSSVADASEPGGDFAELFADFEPPATQSNNKNQNNLVFIDGGVADIDTLISGLPEDTEYIILDTDQNGLEQIARHLDGKTNLDSIHIFSHGDKGELILGNLTLDQNNLSEHNSLLESIGVSLNENADILLYGCNFGQNSDFVDQIADITGADIAASDDLTGADIFGGDWDLEVISGEIETATYAVTDYQNIMGHPSLAGFDGTITFDENTVNDAPQIIDSDVTYSSNGIDLDGETLIIETDGGAEDQLGINNEGTGAGQIGVSGSNITYGGTIIGTIDVDGSNGSNLEITFNSNVTDAAVEALIENLTYANTSDSPTATRTISLSIQATYGDGTGGDMLINSDGGSGTQEAPVIAVAPNGSYVVVWQDTTDENIYMRLYNADGSPVGAEFVVNSDSFGDPQYDPAIAMADDGSFIITWTDERNGAGDPAIYARMFNADGTAKGDNFIVNDDNSTYDQVEADIAIASDGSFIVTWTDYRNGAFDSDIYAQMYDADGTANGANFKINSETSGYDQRDSAVAIASDGSFVVTWKDNRGSSGSSEIVARMFNANGTAKDVDFQVNNINTSNAQITPDIVIRSDGSFAIAWENDQDIHARLYNADGTPVGDEFTVNSNSFGTQEKPRLAVGDDDAIYVVWDDTSTLNWDIFGKVYNADGTERIGDAQVNLQSGGDTQVKGNAAVNSDGSFIVAWEDTTGSGGSDIYTRAFNADGTQKTSVTFDLVEQTLVVIPELDPAELHNFSGSVSFNENTVNSTPQIIDSNVTFSSNETALDGQTLTISTDGGTEDQLGINNEGTGAGQIGVSGTNVTYEGTIIGTITSDGSNGSNLEITLNFNATDAAVEALIEHLTYANTSDNPTASRTVSIDLYETYGDGIGDEFLVNGDGGSSGQTDPVIAIAPDGSYVITWTDQRNGNFDIYARMYNADGTANGSDFLVNDDGGSTIQYTPSIAIAADGSFVITWRDYRSGIHIYAQAYNADGTADGSNFQIDSPSTSTHRNDPTIIMAPDGSFIVTWSDLRNGDYDIYARLFNADGTANGSDFQVNSDGGSSIQYNPQIAIASDGSFIITWTDQRNGNWDIYARMYNADGTANGNEFIINNDGGITDQTSSSIEIAEDGSFVITWSDERNGNYDIYARLFNANGTANGSDFQVNSDGGSIVVNIPSIATASDGSFVITWESLADGDWDILAQSYNADGSTNGGNFLVSSEDSPSSRRTPDIAMDMDDNYIITWKDQRNGNTDIYARAFNVDHTVKTHNITALGTTTVNVTPENDDPVINNQSMDVDENAANGTAVGTVAVSDVDDGDTHTFAITGGNTGNVFAIDNNGDITVNGALNHEATGQYTLTVEVTDAGGLTDTATITIDINDVYDDVANVINSPNEVNGNIGLNPVSVSVESLTLGAASSRFLTFDSIGLTNKTASLQLTSDMIDREYFVYNASSSIEDRTFSTNPNFIQLDNSEFLLKDFEIIEETENDEQQEKKNAKDKQTHLVHLGFTNELNQAKEKALKQLLSFADLFR